jgi:hypothetical protein
MSDRPTPRTDAAANESIVKVYETSKDLERELAEARELVAMYKEAKEEFSQYSERRNLEKQLAAAIRERDNADSDRRQADADTLRALHERNEAREQRDRLAAALEACREDSCELLGERSWWKDEPRCNYSNRYDETAENIVRADEALDSMKGGTSD